MKQGEPLAPKQEKRDRAREDVGNIVHLEHVNVTQPDQRLATLFYVAGLGGTRDPYLMVGLTNMWVNLGQMHLPTGEPQRLRGTIGLVVPDLELLKQRLEKVAPGLAGTQFKFADRGDHVDATCPWGNRFRCHAPAERFGETELAMPYIEYEVPVGAAEGIARFYAEVLGAPAEAISMEGAPTASVSVGRDQRLLFHETSGKLPKYDGHHMQVYLADFSGPYRRLIERGLVTKETDAHEWRFVDIVDPKTGKPLFQIEHEVRSMKHPLFGRPLVNRNPAQTNSAYLRGQDAFRGIY
jgi:predicted enzyme related to lactoylglutathione lyase